MRFLNFYMNKIIKNDLNQLAREKLIAVGYKLDNGRSEFHQLLKLKQMIIEDRPRKVSFSNSFYVPKHCEDGLELLVGKIICGNGEIFRHQTRGLFEGKRVDMLSNDFGIDHLHLGRSINEKGMVEGTKEVAFVYINDDEAFFIKIALHNEWHVKDNLKKIHYERPDLIRHRISSNLCGSNFTDEEIKKMRDLGVNYCLKIDDTHYKSERLFSLGKETLDVITFSDWFQMRIEEEIYAEIKKIYKDMRSLEVRVGIQIVYVNFDTLSEIKVNLGLDRLYEIVIKI